MTAVGTSSGDAGDPPTKGLDVLMLDYEMAREDERASTTATAAMAGVAAALFAGIVAVMVGDCEFREQRDGCYGLPDGIFALMPIVPLTVVSFIQILGTIGTVRSFYLRSLEAALRDLAPTNISNIEKVSAPSGIELQLTITSPRRGRPAFRILLVILFGSCFATLIGLILMLGAAVSDGWRIAMAIIYSPLIVFLVREAYVANIGGRSLFLRAVEGLPAEYPRVNVMPLQGDQSSRSTTRSLALYLLLPRPQDLVKWLFIPVAFLIGLILPSNHTPLPTSEFFTAILLWIGFEYLGYEARYQWNDIRGLADDLRHPSKAQRKRLPVDRWGPAVSVAASAGTAIGRTVLVIVLSVLLGGAYQQILLWGVVGIWAIALVYELARSGHPNKPRFARLRTYTIWFVVGGGYALRIVVGLSLAGVAQSSVAAISLLTASAWALGIVFVTLTWILEAVGHCYSDESGRNYWYISSEGTRNSRVSPRVHVVELIRFSGFTAVPTKNADQLFSQSCDAIRPLRYGAPLYAPWNLALIVSVMLGVAACTVQLPVTRATPLLILAIVMSMLICLASTPAWRLGVLTSHVALMMILSLAVAPSVTVATCAIVVLPNAIYWFFRNSSYADLRDYDVQLAKLIVRLKHAFQYSWEALAKVIVGRRTHEILKSRRSPSSRGQQHDSQTDYT